MDSIGKRILLVGDNPFQGVSHLSQQRARERDNDINSPDYCSNLVGTALANGASGFMFSISEPALAILNSLSKKNVIPGLYAITPAASDYVRLASIMGTPGLALHLSRQVAVSRNYRAFIHGLKGVMTRNPVGLLKAFLMYELLRIKKSTTRNTNPYCLLLHELITEMGLALDIEWLFKEYINFLFELKIKPGFETRNFPMLVEKLAKWGVDLTKLVIVAPFNAIGFQMCPSIVECEQALARVKDTEIIAMSVLASGHLKLPQAIEYIRMVPEIKGIVLGISNEQQACDFKIFRDAL
jgi:hypothetical protein